MAPARVMGSSSSLRRRGSQVRQSSASTSRSRSPSSLLRLCRCVVMVSAWYTTSWLAISVSGTTTTGRTATSYHVATASLMDGSPRSTVLTTTSGVMVMSSLRIISPLPQRKIHSIASTIMIRTGGSTSSRSVVSAPVISMHRVGMTMYATSSVQVSTTSVGYRSTRDSSV